MILRFFCISTVFLFLAIIIFALCGRDSNKNKYVISTKNIFYIELAILSVSIYLHLFLAVLTPTGDSVYFSEVMTKLTEENFYGFYQRIGITYPPLFNYFFYLIGQLLHLFNIPFDYSLRLFVFIIKLPGIISEFLMAAIIYRIAKKYISEGQRAIALFLILLNPGYLFITSYICQIDALYTLFMILTVYLIINRKLKLSYFCFAVAILFKFQTIFITPILIFAIIDQVILHDFSWKRFWSHLITGLSAIACMALSYLPFIYNFQTGEISEGGIAYNFTTSIASYGRTSQNAYNFWTLIGYNMTAHSETFGPFTCNTWGTLFIILIVILCTFFYLRNRNDVTLYPMLATLLISGTFCFAVKMMARYLYPAVGLLVLAYVMKPTLKRFICAVTHSVAFFLVVSFDYMVYPRQIYTKDLILPYFISFYVIACFGFLVYTIGSENRSHER